MADTYIFWKKTCRHYSMVSFEVILMDCDTSGCHYKHADELVALLERRDSFFCLIPGGAKNRNNWEGIWGRIKRIDSKTMSLRVMERFICPTFTSNGSVTRDMWRTRWWRAAQISPPLISMCFCCLVLIHLVRQCDPFHLKIHGFPCCKLEVVI